MPVNIYVKVKNQGPSATGSWFYMDLYADRPAPSGIADTAGDTQGSDYVIVPALAAGQVYVATYTRTFSTGGLHTFYAQADTYDGVNGSPLYGLVLESIEANNIFGPALNIKNIFFPLIQK
jgi:hypothetical protein